MIFKHYFQFYIYKGFRKGAEATYPKSLAKNSNTQSFYYNLYLHFKGPFENIFNIICIVLEKIKK